jgi:tripeptide aminopeptidase
VPLDEVVDREKLVEPWHRRDATGDVHTLRHMATDTHAAPAAELAEDAVERFLRYVRIDTQSDEDSESYPSTAKQLDLLRLLLGELQELGLADAAIDEHGYVTATLPPTVERDVPTIAFFAHVDTARECSGADVQPQRIRYDGGDIVLGDSGQVIRPAESPELEHHAGHDLITTDGTTLLGADDKAGIAEIMAAAAYLLAHPEVPHGPVRVAFNPDEEIGRGVIHFPVDTFGAVAAYTVDGSTAGELQQETFSGAQVRMKIRGRAIHPGWAKGELVNAVKLAAEVIDRLPKDRLSPETTAEREGYVHPVVIAGDSSEVELRFIVRDFENDELDRHVEFLRGIAADVAATDERSSIEVESKIQYRNMRDTLQHHPEIVSNLEEAVRRVGLEPKLTSIRGGTDGSALTEMGLPTPNIFTGGHDAHSEREWICVEDMGLAAATVVELARVWAEE